MSERQSSEFDEHDDHAALPHSPGDGSEQPSSGPLPLRPHGSELPSPPPVFDQSQWPSPPQPTDAEAPPAEPDTPRPGAHRSPTDSETTSIVNRDWLTQEIERHQGNLDRGGAAEAPEPAGPTTGHWQFDAPPPPYGGPGREPRQGAPGRPGPAWQPPPPPPEAFPPPQPRSGYGRETGQPPAPGYGDWSAAQGSAASWNYTDNIRSSEMVPTRRIPPRRGWRKALYYSTFKLINPGQSPDERYEAELIAKVRSLLRGTYKIGVLGKGGVGKSTTAAGVGSIFAELRQDDRVVAVDADTAFGKLAARIDPNVSGSYWEVAGDRNLATFADMRARVGSNAAGLFVLGGAPETARRRVLDPDVYRRATAQLDRHFTLSIIDCGSTMDSAITREVLNDVDALIVVSSPWYDGASAAGQTLEWLANGGYTALLHRTVVVVNDSDGHADKKDLKLLVDRFGKHGQKVIQLPYDPHLRPGGVIDIKSEINPLTRRRLLELAAECAEHFASTTDRPRRAPLPGPPPAAGPHDDRPRGV
ncbi:MinD/ParA family ATP-binding protein [Mycobacterium avium]|uniref:MinD/ParA family ATP-binding protein n=1 Tax=Mycobacterium avium TaxID=1764 RepID=UPI0009FE6D61|nr:MinD/ParA family protein [Mycobacterium avium]